MTPTSSSRPKRRSLISKSVVAAIFATLIATGGCKGEPTNPFGNFASGGNFTGGGGNSGNPNSGGSGAVVEGGGGTSGTGSVPGSGSVPGGGGGPASGGGSGSGSGGVAVEPCEDLPAPPDETWPEATCEKWAAETDACTEDWFTEYCDISCGRCTPQGGGSGGMAAEVCEDLAPPPDPMWPDATCESWANESTACGEAWFANYCDVSCGRCVPEDGSGGPPMAPDCSGENLPNVTGGEGHATRYWDCCQPHCAQNGGHKCSQDGVSVTGDNNSACSNGSAFACYDEAPRKVSECLAYGHIAKANPNCGGCYRIQFTGVGHDNANDIGSKLIQGKQMIVKVSNTGSDVGGTQFDLMIPGGGVGQFNACSRQWGTSDLGAQYGGFLRECSGTHAEKKECVRQECMKIPAGSARDGCIWFVDWFQVADNPNFTSQATDCPF